MMRDGIVTRPLFPRRFRTSSMLLGGIGLEVRAPSRLESDWEIVEEVFKVIVAVVEVDFEAGRTIDVEV